ncbi:hypothetical protein HMPREF0299_5987 [Corynebacterium matruchotii ATCC 14266]|uniref:Uncharacterized protein n=1 Tax=Corynebacterium matruchotii ATCC 14266 TaxID=553207 RepID=E0DCD7_9CORY|nr:hypothetical protein HMPREF0299_5987 [Corynebacterium matruchotii ATCC 14266]
MAALADQLLNSWHEPSFYFRYCAFIFCLSDTAKT